MAKKVKEESEVRRASADDIKQVVRSINQHKDKASEATGEAGKATQTACDKFNLNKTALTFVARLSRMDASKRQDILRTVVDYSDKLGMFDQIDAFDDLIPVLEGIVERAGGEGDQPREAPADVAPMLN